MNLPDLQRPVSIRTQCGIQDVCRIIIPYILLYVLVMQITQRLRQQAGVGGRQRHNQIAPIAAVRVQRRWNSGCKRHNRSSNLSQRCSRKGEQQGLQEVVLVTACPVCMQQHCYSGHTALGNQAFSAIASTTVIGKFNSYEQPQANLNRHAGRCLRIRLPLFTAVKDLVYRSDSPVLPADTVIIAMIRHFFFTYICSNRQSLTVDLLLLC